MYHEPQMSCLEGHILPCVMRDKTYARRMLRFFLQPPNDTRKRSVDIKVLLISSVKTFNTLLDDLYELSRNRVGGKNGSSGGYSDHIYNVYYKLRQTYLED